MSYNFKLTDHLFWERFSKETWERRPFRADNLFATPPIEPDILFTTVAACTKNYDPRMGLRLYVGGEQQQIWPGHPMLPVEADQTFFGYHTRMTNLLKSKFYCLVLNFLELRDFDLWDWSRNFLYDLYARIGFNKLGVYNALFIGDYDRTPFGVHQDPESVFHLPVIGRKAMRIWPNEYKLKQPAIERAQNYQSFLNDSIKIEAGPGGIIYWPSDYWHISEKVNSFSVSLALSLNCHRNVMQLLSRKITAYVNASTALDNKVVVPFDPADPQSSANNIPNEIRIAGEIFAAVTSEEALQKEWLRLVTASNFMFSPDPCPTTDINITEDTVVAGNKKFPIITAKVRNGKLCVSANGHLATFDNNESITKLIGQLNGGVEHEIYGLFNSPAGQTVYDLIRWLQSVRAIAIRSKRTETVEL